MIIETGDVLNEVAVNKVTREGNYRTRNTGKRKTYRLFGVAHGHPRLSRVFDPMP